jgi:hypothetical protein
MKVVRVLSSFSVTVLFQPIEDIAKKIALIFQQVAKI